ncbi:hypothetical protein C0Q70_18304 [Pomacea canaliculata]|uniref:Uncharacterized protein n=2 Tax=Pomacea canaliculata TaxID=400727 RepID=A0A2T7NMU3_POMCA|nr:hypothetical protein C0Q70_18304 [Pomacea canaliculata]
MTSLPVLACCLLLGLFVAIWAQDAVTTVEPPSMKDIEGKIKDNDDQAPKVLKHMCEQMIDEMDEMEAEPKEKRSKRSAGYGYGGLVNYGSAYGDDGYAGGYGGYAGGYNNGGHISYDQTYSHSPVLTFVKGFRPGKSYVEQGKVIRNYYRHGSYEVALQHYKFIPVIKVVPFTSYNTIGYTGHIQAANDYTATICKDCYYGYPKIDVIANRSPYSYVTRRFVYLPESYNIVGGYGNHGGY